MMIRASFWQQSEGIRRRGLAEARSLSFAIVC
jgi:hypothetical protein